METHAVDVPTYIAWALETVDRADLTPARRGGDGSSSPNHRALACALGFRNLTMDPRSVSKQTGGYGRRDEKSGRAPVTLEENARTSL
jgi:hypothetical protein